MVEKPFYRKLMVQEVGVVAEVHSDACLALPHVFRDRKSNTTAHMVARLAGWEDAKRTCLPHVQLCTLGRFGHIQLWI